MFEKNSIRLNKYISESGICSRREADKYIEGGHVFINGKRAKIGDQVLSKDRVVVNGLVIEPKKRDTSIILAYNKPVGVVSTTEDSTKDNILEHVKHSQRIFPIGRLDKDSQGLIFLTNDGDIVNKILRAGNRHEKEYLVTVDKPLTDQFIEAMSAGVPILGEVTKKCIVKKESPFVFRIILIQGLNRQIRRMCEYFGYQVTKLERIRIMNISLKGIPEGDWRELTKQELEGIARLIESSSSVPTSNSSRSKKNKPQGTQVDKPAGKGKPSPPRHVLSIEKKYANAKNRSTKPKRNDPRNTTERPTASRRGKNRKR
ncbi:MAG TPA: 23S rRNA pseudouridine(2604) synthase RluF [Leptospiraceae bacterium]|nr:23S rRNA pseudouridine(2604) synthase RluF [Leptospiraceae bacterium]HRG73017.1 23S rRNA pseudouridine(2604) synthase RluF [Leptospiraceae bacterium]